MSLLISPVYRVLSDFRVGMVPALTTKHGVFNMSNNTPLGMADTSRYLKREIANSPAHMICREHPQKPNESIEPGNPGGVDRMALRVNGAPTTAL